MRHADQIDGDRSAANVLTKCQRQFGLGFLEIAGCQQFAQMHHLAMCIGHLDADDITAWNGSDTNGDGAHGPGNIVGQANHA